jgi:hypothetical protein
MGANRRYFPSNTPYLITNRLAEGLPFVANLYINLMLFGIIARASFKHPGIIICGFLFLANHYHLVIVLRSDPDQLRDFMNYVDGEIAKLVVKWLGKKHVKVWAQQYHAAPLLTSQSTFEKFIYMFANPVVANLTAQASSWFGCSSFYAIEDRTPRRYKCILSKHCPLLPNGPFTKKLQQKLITAIAKLNLPTFELHIQPFAWMDCFADTRGTSETEMKLRFYTELHKQEQQEAQKRKQQRKTLADPRQLQQQNPHKPYKPKKFSPRVFCICSDPQLRLAFIELYKDLCQKAQQTWKRWTQDFTNDPMPHGMFAPPRRARGSILPIHDMT